MPKGDNIKKTISSVFDLPKEIIMDLPYVSMIGCEEFNIENYKGIVEYTDERIRISTSCGILKIEGRKLWIKQITTEEISIGGSITKIEYIV